jgi:hypothetical protein
MRRKAESKAAAAAKRSNKAVSDDRSYSSKAQLRAVSIRGFRSFREPALLELHAGTDGLIACVGANGAGVRLALGDAHNAGHMCGSRALAPSRIFL